MQGQYDVMQEPKHHSTHVAIDVHPSCARIQWLQNDGMELIWIDQSYVIVIEMVSFFGGSYFADGMR